MYDNEAKSDTQEGANAKVVSFSSSLVFVDFALPMDTAHYLHLPRTASHATFVDCI